MFRLPLEVQLSLDEMHIVTRYPTELNKGYLKKFFKNPSAQMRKKGQLVVSHMEIRNEDYGGCMSYYMDQVLKLKQHGSVLCICACISEGAEVLGT